MLTTLWRRVHCVHGQQRAAPNRAPATGMESKMKNEITIGKTIAADRTSDTEAWVYVAGVIRGMIRGNRQNVGSFMHPRFAIVDYTVEVDDVETAHKTRSEAIAYARTVLV